MSERKPCRSCGELEVTHDFECVFSCCAACGRARGNWFRSTTNHAKPEPNGEGPNPEPTDSVAVPDRVTVNREDVAEAVWFASRAAGFMGSSVRHRLRAALAEKGEGTE